MKSLRTFRMASASTSADCISDRTLANRVAHARQTERSLRADLLQRRWHLDCWICLRAQRRPMAREPSGSSLLQLPRGTPTIITSIRRSIGGRCWRSSKTSRRRAAWRGFLRSSSYRSCSRYRRVRVVRCSRALRMRGRMSSSQASAAARGSIRSSPLPYSAPAIDRTTLGSDGSSAQPRRCPKVYGVAADRSDQVAERLTRWVST